MVGTNQKKWEWAALGMLLSGVELPVHLTGVLAQEAPDFVLEAKAGRVGVEVVELVDRRLRAGMVAFRKMQSLIEEALRSATIEVFVHIRTRDGLVRGLTSKRAREEAAVTSHLLEEHFRASSQIRSFHRHELVAAGASSLYEVHATPGDRAWVVGGAQAAGRGLMATVPRIVADKEKKLERYRNRVGGPVWLLMVGGAKFSSGVWSGSIRTRTLETRFDRLFYVDGYDGSAFEVNTR